MEKKRRLIYLFPTVFYYVFIAGFLHGYKSTQQFDADPMSPEVSIFIPHTNIDCSKNYDSMYQENAFEIKGKNAQSRMGVEKSFMLRGQDQNDLQDWFNKLVQISDQFRPEPLFQQGGYGQQQGGEQNRALPPMPEEEKELPDPSSSQQRQYQGGGGEEGEENVIQVPAEYIQEETNGNEQLGAQATQQESQDMSSETHHLDKGKNPAPLSKTENPSSQNEQGLTSQQQEDLNDVVEEDDNWDTVPQQKGTNKTEKQRN